MKLLEIEDVGEISGDHAFDPEIIERPGGMLARRTAAEIMGRHQDLGIAIGRLVEHEIRVYRAVLVIAQIVKQVLTEPSALDGLEEPRRDDPVGIAIDDVDGRRRRR